MRLGGEVEIELELRNDVTWSKVRVNGYLEEGAMEVNVNP